MTSSSSLAVRELPLFPLPGVVLFPGRPLPLHVFEPRYRMMLNTVMESDRQFGVLLWDSDNQEAARVGCSAEVAQLQRLPDDRINILTVGVQRFRLLEYVREKPYRVGLVEWIDDEFTQQPLQGLVRDVQNLLNDVVHLSGKLTDKEIDLPDDLPDDPVELSYWIGGNFQGAADEQQLLLELLDTEKRLRREAEILDTTCKHLAARTALKDTFSDREA
ncbi:LON peptidase substrate-binding domain-containing protein [Synechococcus sp. PCC 7336]|uniref:LON peptidase substrate-binding domain-containing protein n=1 Tax=Synechococcus sp. PCC 7336 TaxID=195250 RepID=UPI0003450FC3|nr:LON peptidase substrate-binding domain-containing protein [Synechococcus sp. PCC 7336]